MMTGFKDRQDGGRKLAEKMHNYAGNPEVVVLGLPRGGVVVACEVAKALKVPMDVFLVRKLGAPGYSELAMGAIASGGVRVLNSRVIEGLGIRQSDIDAKTAVEEKELTRRETAYRGNKPPLNLENRTVILVDDGLATGATMLAAVRAARAGNARRVIVAVPVAAPDSLETIQQEADDAICLMAPPSFQAVGQWYEEFGQTSDEEVCELLAHAKPIRNE
jgi:predicted phosphoribosyltransferase